jgi:hypothetical protein
MSRSRLLCASLLLGVVASPARADFRVFEENAPGEREERSEEAEEVETAERPSEPTAPITADGALPAAAPSEGDGSAAPSEAPAEGTATSNALAGASVEAALVPAAPAEDEPDVLEDLLDDHRWLDITGFLQPGFIVRLDSGAEGISGGVTDDTFWLQRARVGLRAQIFEWLRARFEIEFAPVTLLQDAFVELRLHPAANLRVGQMIVPFLQTFRFNELNIAFLDRTLYTPQRPDREFIRYLAPRDVGVQLYGMVGESDPSRHDPVFEYGLGLFIGRGPNIALNDDGVFLWSARMLLHLQGVPEGVDRENDLDRNDHFRAAVAFGAYSNCDDRANWNRGFTFDFETRYEGLYGSGGFVWLRNGRGGEALLSDSDDCQGQPVTLPDGTMGTIEFVSRGAHLQLQYALPPVFEGLFGPPFDAMTLELLARIDWADAFSPYVSSDPLFGGGPDTPGYTPPSNYTDSDNPPTRWRLTFGLNYYPTGQNQIRLGVNYQLNREAENVVTGTNTFSGVSNDIFWLQLTIGL